MTNLQLTYGQLFLFNMLKTNCIAHNFPKTSFDQLDIKVVTGKGSSKNGVDRHGYG